MNFRTTFTLLIFSILHLNKGQAQTKFDNVLYGVSYYHEYMPGERLDKDIAMMKKANISVVRVGESTWSLFEPQNGKFEFDWMARVLDKMQDAGIKVILGTPTYSIPAWMAHEHPEVLIRYAGGGKAYYGARQNMDITNPTYLFYCERIIRKMMERFAKHPAIIGFQVDNETISRNPNNDDVFTGFVRYVKEKFKSLDTLNKVWGTNYWGMNINTWEEFPTRDGATNPSYKLEWERYKRSIVSRFLQWQSKIVREYKKPNQFVMQDFMTDIQEVDQAEAAKYMDIMSLNVYHPVQSELTGVEIAFAGDYFRNVKKGNYIVAETNAQSIGWGSENQKPPFDGQLRMNLYANLASGANMVAYWHWHTIHNGQETYWKGVLSHDLEPNRTYAEVAKTATELKQIGRHLVNLSKKNEVAILFDHDSNYGLEYMRYSNGGGYMYQWLRPLHESLYRQNIETDIITAREDFSKYKLIVIPPLYISSDTLLQKISNYVSNGGHVVMTMKSGFANENSAVRPVLAPGPLRALCGFHYQEFGSIGATALKGDPFKLGKENYVYDWSEYLVPETCEPLAYYDDKHWGKYPAIVKNKFGKGSALYIGTVPSRKLMDTLLKQEVEDAGVKNLGQTLSYPIITRSGTNGFGKQIHYLFNYSDNELKARYPYPSGTELLTKKTIPANSEVSIPAWGVIIVEEK